MKDSEFTELLNLYLDHEISVADAARLEAEVQANPARRKVYQQYCRMQKACKMLSAEFVAAEAGAATEADKKVVAFDPDAARAAGAGRQRARGFYTLGGLAAAAACVAFVLVNRGTPTVETPATEVAVQTAPAAAIAAKPVVVAVAETAAVAPAARGGIVSLAGARAQGLRAQPTLVADQLFLSTSSTNALLTASVQDSANQLAWIPNVQLAPLSQRVPAEDIRFDTRPTNLRPEAARVLGGAQAQPGAEIEMAAFRFVK